MRVRTATLIALAGLAAAGEAAKPDVRPELKPEPLEVGAEKIPVLPKRDLTFKGINDGPEVKMRYLWFQAFDGKEWGAWRKHSQSFNRETPVTWSPVPEGHLRTYIQVENTSGLKMDDPTVAGTPTENVKVFVIDRTAPTAAITFPANGQKLRGTDRYTVRWEATDPYLRAAPIALRWSRDGQTWETIAENLANTGSHEWTVPQSMTTGGVLRIEATDKAGNVGSATTTGIIVDSVKPRGRVTGPDIAARTDVNLALDVSDAGPATLTGARLWLSNDDGVSWTEGPNIPEPFKTVAWRANGDGRFRLAVVGTDGAGNQTQVPKGKGDDQFVVTVDTTAPSVTLGVPMGVALVSEATTARRDFKPGDKLVIAFKVADANEVANASAVLLQLDPSKPWVELGKDLPDDVGFRWTIPADIAASTQARIKVTTRDAAGNAGEIVAGETFAIQTKVKAATGSTGIDIE